MPVCVSKALARRSDPIGLPGVLILLNTASFMLQRTARASEWAIGYTPTLAVAKRMQSPKMRVKWF